MITEYTHFGLIFTAQDVRNAQSHRAEEPYQTAWEKFRTTTGEDIHTVTFYDALRWCIEPEEKRFGYGIDALRNFPVMLTELTALSDASVHILRKRFGAIQAYEMLRDHPSYTDKIAQIFQDALAQWERPDIHDTVTSAWDNAVKIAAGVALEDAALIDSAVEDVKAIIETIHPAGYIPSIIHARPDDIQNFADTVSAVHALTLAAEAASQVGIDLWAHEKRTVSLMTAAFYPLYYYYYPEKWKWVEGLTQDYSQQIIRSAAGYLEIINRRRPNVRAVNLILKEVRPVIDLTSGGAFTLTHHPAPPPKRRGWFR